MSYNIILTHQEIQHKIKRIAYQIYETFVDEESIVIAGIASKEDYENKGLVLVDDVLNSGTTLIYGVKHFLEVPIKKFKTTVLIDRNHKKYPVKVDFKGISLSTSSQEHVAVIFEETNCYAYLS
jgi:pyrimidine operon attenuation protein/uracil phosphoribosyltransferase